MGSHQNINFNKFPKQGDYLNKRCKVTFNFAQNAIEGTIVRDDIEAPFETIIQLDDGRFVRGSECQYSPA